MSYETDRQWSDQYLPAVKQVVGPRLLVPAPFKLDAKEATDLIILKAKDMRVAVRVRSPGYAERFGNEFTIRYARDTLARTEFAKIMDGFGDWLFYAHAKRDQPGELSRWMLLNLDVFRALLEGADHNLFTIIRNKDDGSSFAVFDITDFPPEFVIDQSEDNHERSRLAA